jgi:hypothetical protein
MEQDLQTELESKYHVSFKIQSVSGAVLTENYITLNANGTEANQQNAVLF